MANTKKLTQSQRKQSKRISRQALKKLRSGLTMKQRKTFLKDGKGIKNFIAQLEKPSA